MAAVLGLNLFKITIIQQLRYYLGLGLTALGSQRRALSALGYMRWALTALGFVRWALTALGSHSAGLSALS